MAEDDNGKLEIIASKEFKANDDLVRIVDYLNKNLKQKQILFGVTRDKEKDVMTINIYEFR